MKQKKRIGRISYIRMSPNEDHSGYGSMPLRNQDSYLNWPFWNGRKYPELVAKKPGFYLHLYIHYSLILDKSPNICGFIL